jgi:hypothetical protein
MSSAFSTDKMGGVHLTLSLVWSVDCPNPQRVDSHKVCHGATRPVLAIPLRVGTTRAPLQRHSHDLLLQDSASNGRNTEQLIGIKVFDVGCRVFFHHLPLLAFIRLDFREFFGLLPNSTPNSGIEIRSLVPGWNTATSLRSYCHAAFRLFQVEAQTKKG